MTEGYGDFHGHLVPGVDRPIPACTSAAHDSSWWSGPVSGLRSIPRPCFRALRTPTTSLNPGRLFNDEPPLAEAEAVTHALWDRPDG